MCEESRAGIKPISLLFILPAHKTSTSCRGHLWDQYAWCQIQQQTQSWSGAGNWSVSLMPGWSLGDDDDHDFDDRDDHNVDVDCQYIGDSPKCGSYITLSSSGRWKYWCHVIQASNVGLTVFLKAVSGKLSHVLFILFINKDVVYLLVMCSLFLTHQSCYVFLKDTFSRHTALYHSTIIMSSVRQLCLMCYSFSVHLLSTNWAKWKIRQSDDGDVNHIWTIMNMILDVDNFCFFIGMSRENFYFFSIYKNSMRE